VNIGSLIRSAERARIFERFYRGIEGQFLAPGSGLGLYVARKIVQAHGGNLDLETERPNDQGTAFLLTIPISHSEAE
jgi:signal transduction histidine kinase